MLMEITNKGKRRIKILRNLYIDPGQTITIGDDLGTYAIRKHADLEGKIIKPKWQGKKIKPKEDDVDDIE